MISDMYLRHKRFAPDLEADVYEVFRDSDRMSQLHKLGEVHIPRYVQKPSKSCDCPLCRDMRMHLGKPTDG